MAGARQHFIDQAQSLNLFFDTDERYISEVIKEALLNPYIKSLYYQRSLRGIKASKGECEVCSG
jgi:ribonucleoside-diphosphate reductase alpha chain